MQRKEFFVNPKIKLGINGVQKGMKAVQIGKKILRFKKKLPADRKRAVQKAVAKQEKKDMRTARSALRAAKRKKAIKEGRWLGLTAIVLWKRFFNHL